MKFQDEKETLCCMVQPYDFPSYYLPQMQTGSFLNLLLLCCKLYNFFILFTRLFYIILGEVNEETLLATRRSRCGLGDPSLSPSHSNGERRRSKRYAISGARWGRQELTFW